MQKAKQLQKSSSSATPQKNTWGTPMVQPNDVPARRARYSQAWCLDVESANRCRMIYFSIFFPLEHRNERWNVEFWCRKLSRYWKMEKRSVYKTKQHLRKTNTKKKLLSWPSGIELDDIECLKANVFFSNQHFRSRMFATCPRFTNTIPQQQMQNNINKHIRVKHVTRSQFLNNLAVFFFAKFHKFDLLTPPSCETEYVILKALIFFFLGAFTQQTI